jgi:hypothetical protein
MARILVHYNEVLSHCDSCGKTGPSWAGGFTSNDLKTPCPHCGGKLRHRLWGRDNAVILDPAGWKPYDMEYTKYLWLCVKDHL